MQPVVFTGLSVSHAEARALVKAEIRPPVRSGDLDRLPDGATVVIIDGVLGSEDVLSVAEVRRALQRRMKILGAASLGALRAHQTHRDGMQGLGWVYQAYVSGRIRGTDEISVHYDPLSCRPVTIPLVNVRFCLLRSVEQGLIAEGEAGKTMAELKRIPGQERSRRAVILRLRQILGADRLKSAVKDLAGLDSNIKRQDALGVLQTIGSALIVDTGARAK